MPNGRRNTHAMDIAGGRFTLSKKQRKPGNNRSIGNVLIVVECSIKSSTGFYRRNLRGTSADGTKNPTT